MKLLTFPSIEQFRTIVKYVNDRCEHKKIAIKPKLRFHGTVKLHGSNSAIVWDGTDMYTQSRRQVLSLDNDNMGFTRHIAENAGWQAAMISLLDKFKTTGFQGHDPDYEDIRPEAKNAHTVVVYGEWCGGSIQDKVALTQLPKQFVVFAIKFLREGKVLQDGEWVDGQISTWLMPWDVQLAMEGVKTFVPNVTCIEDYPTFSVTIDFNNPHEIQNVLAELTLAVEAECPFGKANGVSGIGEGIVWTCIGTEGFVEIPIHDLTFKTKGPKHSDTHTKTTVPVDIEKINGIKALAAAVGTVHRFEKALDIVRQEHLGTDVTADNRYIGEFIKWLNIDIAKEETDTIIGNGFDVKEVSKAAADIGKVWFKEQGAVKPIAGLKA
jgi:hypothetical protein